MLSVSLEVFLNPGGGEVMMDSWRAVLWVRLALLCVDVRRCGDDGGNWESVRKHFWLLELPRDGVAWLGRQ